MARCLAVVAPGAPGEHQCSSMAQPGREYCGIHPTRKPAAPPEPKPRNRAAPAPQLYHGVSTGVSGGTKPRLQLINESTRRLTEVPLTRADLTSMIIQAGRALEQLDKADALELRRLRAADRQAALENER